LFVTERSFGLMEPPAAPKIERLFQRYDANHDGVIDAKEFEEGMKLLAPERARPPREGRPQARPGPRPEARPGDESPPPPADMAPRPAPHSGRSIPGQPGLTHRTPRLGVGGDIQLTTCGKKEPVSANL
jgi:hypothetical protein